MSTDVEQLQYPTTSLTEQLSCPVCTNILQRPVELSCGVIICSTCCSKWVTVCMAQRLQISCPCCHSHLLDRQSIRPPPPLVLSLLAGVLVYCGKGCGKLVRYDSYDKHVAGNCQGHYHHQVDSPSKMTLRDVLARPVPTRGQVSIHQVIKLTLVNNACTLNRFAYLVYTFPWASLIVSGICWKPPASSWMSRWQKPTLVVALVVVVPSNCTQLLSNSTHPSSLRWRLRRNR